MSAEKYLLNEVRNPQFLPLFYQLIEQGVQTEDELQDRTQTSDNVMAEALIGLRLYGMVEKRDFGYEPTSMDFADSCRNPFKVQLLHNIGTRLQDGDDWSKQAAIPLVYAYLLREDIEYFQYTDATLRRNIDNYHTDELDFNPTSSQGRQDLNQEKFNIWTKQARFLGLVHNARKSEHTVYPEPSLILDTLELAIEECELMDDTTIAITEYIEWLRSNLLYVPFEDATVPIPLARTLYILARRGHIELTRTGDPGSVTIQGIPTHLSNVRERTNSIRLL